MLGSHQMSHRVLVVDDDHDIRELTVAALEVAGYLVISAADGQEGLDLLASASPLPSLILLDMMMPAMNGQTFRNLQKQNPAVAHVAVVVVSAYPDLARLAQEMGAIAYVEKPADLRELLQIVKAHCDALDAREHPVLGLEEAHDGAGADAAPSPSDDPEPS